MVTEKSLELHARRAIAEKRVKLVKIKGAYGASELFLVESTDRKKVYVVIPGVYCSCPDFLFHVHLERSRKKCYHMVAVELAIREKKYVEEEIEEDRLTELVVKSFLE
ncbi:SWIM zinc finger family protein [Thermofilum pendens]|uniref:Zinc finger, SWIM domain protein n=1 Tax=Thermofilum pendens (strain DSM 2475 / Hrk 5) TaxID=368408 RepID=A1RXV3_THEPD|nr:SWIM zinc finger family protein [Thermofilum pendens]ABL78033.1 zinc finger, SWIM domain protein [Thermofilum pendens Hrk 5]